MCFVKTLNGSTHTHVQKNVQNTGTEKQTNTQVWPGIKTDASNDRCNLCTPNTHTDRRSRRRLGNRMAYLGFCFVMCLLVVGFCEFVNCFVHRIPPVLDILVSFSLFWLWLLWLALRWKTQRRTTAAASVAYRCCFSLKQLQQHNTPRAFSSPYFSFFSFSL